MLKNNNTHSISTDRVEGKLLLAAVAILTSETYINQTPDTVIKNIELLANKIFYTDEMKIKEELKQILTTKIEELYYNDSNTKIGDDIIIPAVVLSTIDDKIEDLFDALKSHGLFTDGPYQH